MSTEAPAATAGGRRRPPARPPSDKHLKQVLDATLTAMERLMKLFHWERILHLVVGIVAFLMLIASVTIYFINDSIDSTALLLVFGSSGLITVSAARITYFFNKGFVLVNDIVRAILTTTQAGAAPEWGSADEEAPAGDAPTGVPAGGDAPAGGPSAGGAPAGAAPEGEGPIGGLPTGEGDEEGAQG